MPQDNSEKEKEFSIVCDGLGYNGGGLTFTEHGCYDILYYPDGCGELIYYDFDTLKVSFASSRSDGFEGPDPYIITDTIGGVTAVAAGDSLYIFKTEFFRFQMTILKEQNRH